MHYNINYNGLTRYQADEKAIEDIREYLTVKQWDIIMQSVGQMNADKEKSFQAINFMLSFTGVQGYPVHAFGRRYCLKKYREWMASEPDPIITDEEGFWYLMEVK
jgi:hypothetical protein